MKRFSYITFTRSNVLSCCTRKALRHSTYEAEREIKKDSTTGKLDEYGQKSLIIRIGIENRGFAREVNRCP